MMRKPALSDWIARGVEGLGKLDWVRDVYAGGRPHRFGNLDGVLPDAADFHEAWAWIGANFDPSLTWSDLDFIRKHWDGPIVLKGVMTVEDRSSRSCQPWRAPAGRGAGDAGRAATHRRGGFRRAGHHRRRRGEKRA